MSDRDVEILGVAAKSVAVQAARPRTAHFRYLTRLMYLVGDLWALTLAHMVAVRGIEHFLAVPGSFQNPYQYHRYYIPFFAITLYLFDGYKSPELRRPDRELELGCKAVFASFVALMVLNFLVFKDQPLSRYLMIIWFGLSCLFLLTIRSIFRVVYSRLWKVGLAQRKAILIGDSSGLSGFQQSLSIQRYNGYKLLGLISETGGESLPKDLASVNVLGTLDKWQSIIERSRPDVLIVSLPSSTESEDLLRSILSRSKDLGIDLELYSRALASSQLNCEPDDFSGCLRFYASSQWSNSVQRVFKALLDVVFGVVGSFVTVLLIPVIGLIIKLQDGGPIFYRSAYLGQDRRNWYYLKFRTMRVNADEILQNDAELKSRFAACHKLKDDPRITPFGRFLRKLSLDEFPQFFSLLAGELSFVGPRTIRQEEAYRYGSMLPQLLSVKPGMTGFWQVMGRQTTTYDERVQMDLFYIEHWSIWLDLILVGKTFWKVLKGEGAY